MLVLSIVMLITAVLFVLNFRFPKPTNKELAVIIIVVLVAVVYLLYEFNWKEYYGWNLKDIFVTWKKVKV